MFGIGNDVPRMACIAKVPACEFVANWNGPPYWVVPDRAQRGPLIPRPDTQIREDVAVADIHVEKSVGHGADGSDVTVGGGRERRAGELAQLAAHEVALDLEAGPISERVAEREIGIESEIFIEFDLAGAET